MKTLHSIFAVGAALLSLAGAAETPKPAVTLSVKRQLLDSEHDKRGIQGNTSHKTITLRVEIINATLSSLPESELSGEALVTSAIGEKEKLIKESLGTVKLPAMKPNEKLTLDLGKIKLSELEWRNRKFEETLEEWKVVCKQGQTETGKALSSDRFDSREKEVEPAAPEGNGRFGPQPRKIRRLGD